MHIVYIVSSVYTYMRLRTDGVNTNGTAAKINEFLQIWEKGTPRHFWRVHTYLHGKCHVGSPPPPMKY